MWRSSGMWLAILASLLAGYTAWGQQPNRGMIELGVRPQLINLSGGPGARHTFKLYLRNYHKTRASTVYIGAADAAQQLSGSLRFSGLGETPYSAAPWVQLNRNKVTIAPNNEIALDVTLQIPAKTGLAGDYSGIISVSTMPPNVPMPKVAGEDEIVAMTRMRVVFGVIIHVDVGGNRQPTASIEDIRFTDQPQPGSGRTRLNANAQRWVVMRLANEGNTLLYSHGWAVIRNAEGRLIQRWQIGQRDGEERLVVYPQRRVETYLPIERPIPPGEYEVESRITYGPGKVAVGKRKVTITRDGTRFVTTSSSFTPLTVGLAVDVESHLKKLSVAPRAVRTDIIAITNNEPKPVRITASLFDVNMASDGTLIPFRREPQDPHAVGNWLRMHKRGFTLFPGETRKVPYAVSVPPRDAISRDLFGMVRFEANELDVVKRERGEIVIGEAEVLVLASFQGGGKREIKIGVPELKVRPELDGQIRLGIPLSNTGNVTLEPTGSLEFTSSSAPEFVWERPLFMAGQAPLILPGGDRLVWLSLPRQTFKTGEYQGMIFVHDGSGNSVKRAFTMKLMDDPPASQDNQSLPETNQ